MFSELTKLQNLLDSVKDNLTGVIDTQIQTHEVLKEYYRKLLNYAQDAENQKRLKVLEEELVNSQENINKMKQQIDEIVSLSKKGYNKKFA